MCTHGLSLPAVSQRPPESQGRRALALTFGKMSTAVAGSSSSDEPRTEVDGIIEKLLEVRGSRPGKQVNLSEAEIRGLCTQAREIFMNQPVLLELEAPIKICGALLRVVLVAASLGLPRVLAPAASLHLCCLTGAGIGAGAPLCACLRCCGRARAFFARLRAPAPPSRLRTRAAFPTGLLHGSPGSWMRACLRPGACHLVRDPAL